MNRLQTYYMTHPVTIVPLSLSFIYSYLYCVLSHKNHLSL